jgi:hypothetical protein
MMRIDGPLGAILGAIALAGCAATGGLPLPEAPVQAVPAEGLGLPQVQAGTTVTARAFGPEGEIAGARCRLFSRYFAAEFASPARVVVPDLGRAAPVVQVDCATGTLRGEASVGPDFRGSGGWGYGGGTTIGVGVATGGDVSVGLGTYWSPWGWGGGWGPGPYGPVRVRYPEVRVQMR